jgi:hypothetical protein
MQALSSAERHGISGSFWGISAAGSATHRAGAPVPQAGDQRASVDLPQPLWPDDPQRLAGSTWAMMTSAQHLKVP